MEPFLLNCGMVLFKKHFTIKTAFTKDEAVALLGKNIEPSHTHGSIIPFEGNIDEEGNFKLALAPQLDWYRQPSAWVEITGKVEATDKYSQVIVWVNMKPDMPTLSVMILFMIVLFTGIGVAIKSPSIIIMFLFIVGFLYFGFYNALSQTNSRVKQIMQNLLSSNDKELFKNDTL